MIRWVDGMDWFSASATGSPFQKYPDATAGIAQVAAENGQFAQGGLHLINGDMNFIRTFTAHTVWNAHIAMRPRQSLRTDYNTLFFRFESVNAAGTVLAIRYNPSAQLEVMKGGSGTNSAPGTLVGTVLSPILVVDTWVSWEFCVVQAGANSTFQIYADDVLVLDMGPTGANGPLDLTGLGTINRVTFRWEASFGPEFDNYVVSDDQGTVNNTRLGPLRVVSTIMASDSFTTLTRNTGTSDASCINELLWPPGLGPGIGVPDGDQTYLTGTNTFGLWVPSPFACTAKILGLALNGCFKGLTTDQLAFLFKTGAVQTTVGTASPAANNVYEVLQVLQELSLVTGLGWVDGEINSNLWGLSPSAGRITQYVLEKVLTLRTVPYTCGSSPQAGQSYAF